MPSTRDLNQADKLTNTDAGSIPRIDLKRLPNDIEEIVKLKDACFRTGFFVLENARELTLSTNRTYDQMQNFFSLPDEHKIKQAVSIRNTKTKHGWEPIFSEPAYQPGTVAHMESFGFGPDGSTSWPELPKFESRIRNYWNTLIQIGDTVLESIAMASDMDPQFLREHCKSQQLSTMRLLHYPQNNAPDLAENVGIAAHTDFECITLISQTAPGLELRTRTGEWIDAPAERDQIVVLLGDMLERWTNGSLQATGHRVRNTRSQRMSIVLFIAVDDGVEVKPLPNFVADRSPSKFKPTDQRSHLESEINQAKVNRLSVN